MGADLYIHEFFAPLREQWDPEFRRALAAGDIAPDEASSRAARERADHAWEQMYSRGYFRDSYNAWNLLWKFGLTWWTDVIPMLDEDDSLSPQQAARLLDMLAEREPQFEAALAKLKNKDRQYFEERYVELKKFFREAIELNQPIVCSL